MNEHFVCGARKVIPGPRDTWRVICATCGAGGAVLHETRDEATKACVRDSSRPCSACGAA